MKIRCVIVDDEPPAVEELKFILSEIEDVEVVGSAGSASEAIQAIKKFGPDLVFLDIKMPRKNGFHVVQEISKYAHPPLIVFATAYDQYAIRAFEESAIDYILKPFSEERIRKSLARVRKTLISQDKALSYKELKRLISGLSGSERGIARISVDNKGHILLLNPEDIFFCKAEQKRITVFTLDNQFACHTISSLGELEKSLKPHTFFRTHRAYLVNLSRIMEVIPWFSGRYLLIMSDKSRTEVPVSRGRVKDLKENLGL